MRDIIRFHASEDPGRPCLTYAGPESTVHLNYGEFHHRVRRLANGLRRLGLTPGDRCVIHLGNSFGFVLAFWALQELEAIAVPTIVQYAGDELEYVVEHCGAWGIVTDVAQLDKVRAAIGGRRIELVVDGSGSQEITGIDDLISSSDDATLPGNPNSEEALMMYTSGTTSRPKGVVLGHSGTVFTGQAYANHFRIQPADRVLTCMPLFHINGMCIQMLPALISGASYVVTPKFSVSLFWQWMREHEITVAHLVSGPIRLLMAEPPSELDRRHQVRLMSFGLPLETEEIQAFERRFGLPLCMLWGLTETAGAGTSMPPYFGRRPLYQGIGPAMPGFDVQAIDDAGRALPAGEVGELGVRGPGVMLRYHGDEASTREVLRDGWLLTGDLGYLDPDGYGVFLERKKDMLKPSGENVAASEIERVISEYPGILECGVVGVPDPNRHEAVVAFVVAEPGMELEIDKVKAWCRERLAPFKVPARIELRTELPKTSIGKIQKGELRRLAMTPPYPHPGKG